MDFDCIGSWTLPVYLKHWPLLLCRTGHLGYNIADKLVCVALLPSKTCHSGVCSVVWVLDYSSLKSSTAPVLRPLNPRSRFCHGQMVYKNTFKCQEGLAMYMYYCSPNSTVKLGHTKKNTKHVFFVVSIFYGLEMDRNSISASKIQLSQWRHWYRLSWY